MKKKKINIMNLMTIKVKVMNKIQKTYEKYKTFDELDLLVFNDCKFNKNLLLDLSYFVK